MSQGCSLEGWKPAPGLRLQDGFVEWLGKLGDGKWIFGEYRGPRVDRVEVTVKGGSERRVFHVVRDFVICSGVAGVVRHNIEGDAGLPLPPAPVYPLGTPCMVRVRWGRKVGPTWDYYGMIEAWPEAGASSPVAFTVTNNVFVLIEDCANRNAVQFTV